MRAIKSKQNKQRCSSLPRRAEQFDPVRAQLLESGNVKANEPELRPDNYVRVREPTPITEVIDRFYPHGFLPQSDSKHYPAPQISDYMRDKINAFQNSDRKGRKSLVEHLHRDQGCDIKNTPDPLLTAVMERQDRTRSQWTPQGHAKYPWRPRRAEASRSPQKTGNLECKHGVVGYPNGRCPKRNYDAFDDDDVHKFYNYTYWNNCMSYMTGQEYWEQERKIAAQEYDEDYAREMRKQATELKSKLDKAKRKMEREIEQFQALQVGTRDPIKYQDYEVFKGKMKHHLNEGLDFILSNGDIAKGVYEDLLSKGIDLVSIVNGDGSPPPRWPTPPPPQRAESEEQLFTQGDDPIPTPGNGFRFRKNSKRSPVNSTDLTQRLQAVRLKRSYEPLSYDQEGKYFAGRQYGKVNPNVRMNGELFEPHQGGHRNRCVQDTRKRTRVYTHGSGNDIVAQGGQNAVEQENGPRGAPVFGTSKGTGIEGGVIDTGFDIYNTVQKQRADAQGLDQYELYGGNNHPSGRPLGLSAMNATDKAAQERMDAEKSGRSILDDITSVGSAIAGLFTESDEVPQGADATMIVADPQVAELAQEQTTASIPPPLFQWDYQNRADRRWLYTRLTLDASWNGNVYDVGTLVRSHPGFRAVFGMYNLICWDSITVFVHYETNGTYGGIGRAVYLPGWTAGSVAEIPRYLETGIGEEFFYAENTELEFVLPYTLPIPAIPMKTAVGIPADMYRLLGAFVIGPIAPFKAPNDVVQSIQLQITLSIQNLRPGAPTAITTYPAVGGDLVTQSDEIFYYPTTNRMQGRYRTTRLAGPYSARTPVIESQTSVAYLSSIWTLRRKLTMNVNSTDSIQLLQVKPHSYLQGLGGTIIDFLIDFAAMWSGTFEGKLQFSASNFHRMQFCLSWAPIDEAVGDLAINMQRPHVILDLNDSYEHCFVFPNITPFPVRYSESILNENTMSLGQIILTPYAPLVKTTIVWDTIDILLWWRGHQSGDAHQFRLYNPVNYSQYNRNTNTQTLLTQADSNMITIADHCVPDFDTTGYEEIVDLLQLTSRATPLFYFSGPYSGTGGVVNFQPLHYSCGLFTEFGTTTTAPLPNVYLDVISRLFAWWHGDLDVMAQSDADILILRQLPFPAKITDGGNLAFGSGPGMIRFESTTTMVTCKLSPYSLFSHMAMRKSFNEVLGAPASKTIFDTASSLIIDSYHSDTKRTAQEALLYFSTAANFIISGYVALPPLTLVGQLVSVADAAAESFYHPPTVAFIEDRMRSMYLPLDGRRITPARDDESSIEELPPGPSNLVTQSDERPTIPISTPERLSFENEHDSSTDDGSGSEVESEEDEPPDAQPLSFYQQLRQMPTNINEATKSMTLLTETLNKHSTRLANLTSRTVETVNETANDFSTFLKQFSSFSSSDMALAAVLGVDLIECLISGGKIKWIGFVTKIAISLAIKTTQLVDLATQAYTYFMSPNQPLEGEGLQTQADFTPQSVSMILSVVVMAIGIKTAGGANDKKNLSLWELMAARGREAHGLKMGISALTEGYKVIYDSIIEGVSTYVFDDKETKSVSTTRTDLMNKLKRCSEGVREMHEHDALKYIMYQPTRRAQFKHLYNELNDLRHRITILGDRDLSYAFLSMKTHIDDLVSAAMDNAPDHAVRLDPPCYYIYGNPGVGKSGISVAIAKAVLLSQKQPITGNIYTRTELAKFHDNYAHQYVYIVDDGNMVNDAEVAMESIQRKSNVPMVLEMADLKKKGMYFTSKCLITTSNTSHPHINGITKTDALWRRRNLLIEAALVDDKQNANKIKHASDFSHMKYRFCDPMDPTKTVSNYMDFYTLIHEICVFHSAYMIQQTSFVLGIQPDIPVDPVVQVTHKQKPYTQKIYNQIVQDMQNGVTDFSFIRMAEEDQPTLVTQMWSPQKEEFFDAEEDHFEEAQIHPILEAEEYHSLRSREKTLSSLKEYHYIGCSLRDHVYEAFGYTPDGEKHIFAENHPRYNAIVYQIAQIKTDDQIPKKEAHLLSKLADYLNLPKIKKYWDDPAIMRRALKRVGIATVEFLIAYSVPAFIPKTVKLPRSNDRNLMQMIDATHMRLTRIERRVDNCVYEMERYLTVKQRVALMTMRAAASMTIMPLYAYNIAYNWLTEVISKFIWKKIKWLWQHHPIAAVLVGATCAAALYYLMFRRGRTTKAKNKKQKAQNLCEEDQMRIQDHYHHDLPDDGQKYVHVHLCERCNMAFTHFHKKNSYEVSSQFSHYCQACYKRKIAKAHFDAMNPSGEEPNVPILEDEIGETESVGKASAKDPKPRGIIRLESDNVTESVGKAADNSLKASRVIRLEQSIDEIKQQKLAKITELITQSSVDENCNAIATSIENSQGRIYNVRGGSVGYLGLGGRAILTTRHITLPRSTEAMNFVIERLGLKYEVSIYPQQFIDVVFKTDDGKDCYEEFCVLDLSEYARIPSFPDITRHIPSEADLHLAQKVPLMIQVIGRDGKVRRHTSKSNTFIGKTYATHIDKSICGIPSGVEYDIPTTVGDCGGVLLAMNARLQNKIVAMHCFGPGGGQNLGYGFLLTKEKIASIGLRTQAVYGTPHHYLSEITDYIEDDELPAYTPPGRHIIIGKIKHKPLVTPLKSDIKPSPIFDRAFKHTTEPAVLAPKDPRNTSGETPLKKCVKKFDTDSGDWPLEDRKVAREFSLQEFLQYSSDYQGPRRLLTQDEAVNGIPGYIEPLNMRTSAGYPFVLQKPAFAIGKTGFFERAGENPDGSPIWRAKELLQKEIDTILRTAREERWCYANFYMDWLKDERRKIERVRLGKTRMFNIHNCAWLVVMKMYYGAAMAAYQFASFKNGSTLGIDMHGADVTRLVRHLNTAGDNWWDLDIPNFDGGVGNEEVADAIFVLKGWLRKFCEVDHVLDVVGTSSEWRLHVCGILVYDPLTGLPSGWLLTATIDTEVNKQRRDKVWMRIMRAARQLALISLKRKRELAREVGNGDDILGSVNDIIAHLYNPANIAKALQEVGIDASPPTKEEGASVKGFRSLDQVTYLKCNFKHHEVYTQFYVAQMAMNTVTELTNWVRTSPNDMTMLRSNIKDMELFLYTHGEVIYNQTLDEVEKAMNEVGEAYYRTPYSTQEQEWRARHQLP